MKHAAEPDSGATNGPVAPLSLLVSAAIAAAFLLAASFIGDYEAVARFAGAAWVFLLSLIVTMPLAGAWRRRRR